MPGNKNNKRPSGKKPAPRGKSSVKQYASRKLNKAESSFHIKLKHVLGGVSLLSLLAAFEVFSIPASNGIIELYALTKLSAAEVWFGTASLTGFIAIYLHHDEEEKDI